MTDDPLADDPLALDPNNNASQTKGAQEQPMSGKRARGGKPLHISEDWLRLAIDNVQDFAIITLNAAGTIVAWNVGAERLFGWHENEVLGYPPDFIFTPEDRACNAHIEEIATARARGRAADERWHLRKDGSRFYVSGVLTSLWEDGLIGYVKIARDLTERKQAEDALQQLNETLESRVIERTEQISNLVMQLTVSEQAERRRISQILHDDLQQRLYSINFQLTTARHALRRGESEVAQQTLLEIEAALNNAVEITRSLSVDLSPPILHEEGLFEAIRWLALHMQQQQGLTVNLDATEAVLVPDEDLRVLLFQTVRELLFNVVKHAGVADAMVTITRGEEQIQIQVSDHGDGFDMNAEHGQNSQGLRRIQQRMQLVGGSLTVEAAPGQGTRVTLTSPFRRAM